MILSHRMRPLSGFLKEKMEYIKYPTRQPLPFCVIYVFITLFIYLLTSLSVGWLVVSSFVYLLLLLLLICLFACMFTVCLSLLDNAFIH